MAINIQEVIMLHLVTSGCSFSDNHTQKWPHYLAANLGARLYNRGQQSCGNDWIRRTAIYQCEELLNSGVSPNDILVVVMWSGIDRLSLWINREQTPNFDKLLDEHKQPLNYQGTEPNTVWGKSSTERGWQVGSINCNFNSPTIQEHKTEAILKFFPDEALAIHSWEQWLMLQWYCQSKGLRLICSTWRDEMHYPEVFNGPPKMLTWERWESVRELHKQIDWTNWIFWKEYGGQDEFCRNRRLTFEADNSHPTKESNQIWVDEIVLPWLRAKNII